MQRFHVRWILAASLLAATSSAAMAQPGGGGRGRGGFGFGGFGVSGLLAMAEVQKEIGLSEAEAAKLTEALRALQPERGGGPGGNQNQDLSDEERQKRRDEFRKQMEETAKKVDEKVKATLTDAQYKRLNELRLQRENVGSLERAEVADKLKLTADQKEKIQKISADARPQFGRRGEGGGERPNFEEMRAKREKANADILAVLTPEQKSSWEAMKGAKFEFPQRGPGGRGGRGNRPAAE